MFAERRQLLNNCHFPDLLHILLWLLCRITQSCHTINNMILRNSEGIQDLADGRAVADALELIDPDGTDAEGPGCDEDVLKSTGVVFLSKWTFNIVGRDDQNLWLVHIVAFAT